MHRPSDETIAGKRCPAVTDRDSGDIAMASDLARAALGYAETHRTDSVTVLVTALLLAARAESETAARLAVAVQAINDARAYMRTRTRTRGRAA